jgi:hypothetical protein
MSKSTLPQKVTEITQELCKTLRVEINAALKSVGDAHGVTLALGNINYSESKATARITIISAGGNPQADDFRRWATGYGLDPTDLGKDIEIEGVSYTIVGINPGSGVRPIMLRRADGADYRFNRDVVREALGLKLMTSEELHAAWMAAKAKVKAAGK